MWKKNIRMGVISEPPPTPVRPTKKPTIKPAIIKPKSMRILNKIDFA
jgi:hypothetical protein